MFKDIFTYEQSTNSRAFSLWLVDDARCAFYALKPQHSQDDVDQNREGCWQPPPHRLNCSFWYASFEMLFGASTSNDSVIRIFCLLKFSYCEIFEAAHLLKLPRYADPFEYSGLCMLLIESNCFQVDSKLYNRRINLQKKKSNLSARFFFSLHVVSGFITKV